MTYDKSTVSIIIACKNEGEGIGKILKSVKKYSNDILVIDGHSKDGTREIAKKMGARFFLDHKLGRGDALKIGIKNAKNEILVFFDADGSHNEKYIPNLVKPILNKEADLVIGSRRTGGSFDMNIDFIGILRSVGSDFLTAIVNHSFKVGLTDILFSLRAIRKSTALNLKLKSNDFCIEQEMIISVLKNGHKIKEIPTQEMARKWGKSKLKTITGVRFIFSLLKQIYL